MGNEVDSASYLCGYIYRERREVSVLAKSKFEVGALDFSVFSFYCCRYILINSYLFRNNFPKLYFFIFCKQINALQEITIFSEVNKFNQICSPRKRQQNKRPKNNSFKID